LETCDSGRDDDRNWIQDWEFDEEDGREWIKIEDDDDDSEQRSFFNLLEWANPPARCIAAISNGDWANDQLDITIDQCSNNSELQVCSALFPHVLRADATAILPSPPRNQT
jgi:hypothetical protein